MFPNLIKIRDLKFLAINLVSDKKSVCSIKIAQALVLFHLTCAASPMQSGSSYILPLFSLVFISDFNSHFLTVLLKGSSISKQAFLYYWVSLGLSRSQPRSRRVQWLLRR